ncbi:MAG: 4-(cytidine 5'-diphospho)-2-C-methyl-D-erythritol kinase [Chloroflexota bacterium]|nr:4-(cytidine 5'-diphospho)-2-C-methyl-D-erythritol kinase [Chloroflexota bacterium]
MTPRTGSLELEAPAKLNLSLSVTGRRDGYHELTGVWVLLELADRLLLSAGATGLRVAGPAANGVPADRDANLAWRGLVAGVGAEPSLAWLALDKRVPAAAGLGGGSSDAAAAWRLGRAWSGGTDAPATTDELAALARLGADVPFFAAQAALAAVSGIGERVAALDAPGRPLEVVLLNPGFGLSTAEVFAELRPEDWSRAEWGPRIDAPKLTPGSNDLLAAARRLRPELDDLMRIVRAAGGDPRLTGSGPTIYSLSDDPERAAALAAQLAERLPAGEVRISLTRTRLQAASIRATHQEEA